MAIHDLLREHAEYHRGQVLMLTPDSPRLWGEMDPGRMMRHLRALLEVSLGEAPARRKAMIPKFLARPVAWLFFDVFTKWPPSKAAAAKALPEVFPDSDLPFVEERQALLDAIDRFTARCESNPEELRFHPVLGPIPLRRWARVHGVHMNHHYRQYGLVGILSTLRGTPCSCADKKTANSFSSSRKVTDRLADPNDRYPDNVPGPFFVDINCLDCDCCRSEAPNNFARNEKGYCYVAKQPENKTEFEQCLKAVEGCPLMAIWNYGEEAAETPAEGISAKGIDAPGTQT